jgi:hypothetical protein
MSRDISGAADRLIRADDAELKTIASHDPSMIRDVAAALRSCDAQSQDAIAYIQSAYDELCVKFSGAHSDDEMDSVLLRLHAGLKKLGGVSSTNKPPPFNGTVELTDEEFEAMERECWGEPVAQTDKAKP